MCMIRLAACLHMHRTPLHPQGLCMNMHQTQFKVSYYAVILRKLHEPGPSFKKCTVIANHATKCCAGVQSKACAEGSN